VTASTVGSRLVPSSARAVLLGLVASALLAACATPTDPGGATTPSVDLPLDVSDVVVGVRWEPAPEWAAQVVQDAGMENRDTPFVLLHEDGTLEGSDGCNGIGGSWALVDGRLTLELGPSTLMACAGPAVPRLLASAPDLARDGEGLTFTLDDGTQARLVPAAP
jgi:heat shock protein HslJ